MRFVRSLGLGLLVLATLALAGCAAMTIVGLDAGDAPAGVSTHRDLVFDARHHLALDVYQPVHADHAPVLVFFHGGSWMRGKRAWYRFVGHTLAEHGIVSVIPDYRKVPKVDLGGFMRDAANAVAWAHTHAAEFGGDADDVFVMGHSSGGHMAALLATDPQWLAAAGLSRRELAGCIGLAGVYTFLPDDEDDDEMLAVFGETPSSRRRASPLAHIDGGVPPMLLLQGLADNEVDPDNSRRLAAALKAHDDEVTLKLYADIGHSALLLALAQPSRAPTLTDVLAFVHAHAKSAAGRLARMDDRARASAP